jgi:uncharacterized lipoprotein YmbA
MKKKLLMMLLVFGVCLMLAACSSTTEPTSSSSTPDTATLQQGKTLLESAVRVAIRMKKNPQDRFSCGMG